MLLNLDFTVYISSAFEYLKIFLRFLLLVDKIESKLYWFLYKKVVTCQI